MRSFNQVLAGLYFFVLLADIVIAWTEPAIDYRAWDTFETALTALIVADVFYHIRLNGAEMNRNAADFEIRLGNLLGRYDDARNKREEERDKREEARDKREEARDQREKEREKREKNREKRENDREKREVERHDAFIQACIALSR